MNSFVFYVYWKVRRKHYRRRVYRTSQKSKLISSVFFFGVGGKWYLQFVSLYCGDFCPKTKQLSDWSYMLWFTVIFNANWIPMSEGSGKPPWTTPIANSNHSKWMSSPLWMSTNFIPTGVGPTVRTNIWLVITINTNLCTNNHYAC